MRPIIPDYLAEALRDVAADTSGEPAGYLPELTAANPERLGAAFAMIAGDDGRDVGQPWEEPALG
jgi:glutaminase